MQALVAILTDCVRQIEQLPAEQRPRTWQNDSVFSPVTHLGLNSINFHSQDVIPRYMYARRLVTDKMIHEACAIVNKYQLRYDSHTRWFYFRLIG